MWTYLGWRRVEISTFTSCVCIAQDPHVDAEEPAEYLKRPVSPGGGWEPGPERDQPASEETSVVHAMAALKAAGANVLVGCTYEPTTRKIVQALELVDFSPRATVVSSSLGLDTYHVAPARGSPGPRVTLKP